MKRFLERLLSSHKDSEEELKSDTNVVIRPYVDGVASKESKSKQQKGSSETPETKINKKSIIEKQQSYRVNKDKAKNNSSEAAQKISESKKPAEKEIVEEKKDIKDQVKSVSFYEKYFNKDSAASSDTSTIEEKKKPINHKSNISNQSNDNHIVSEPSEPTVTPARDKNTSIGSKISAFFKNTPPPKEDQEDQEEVSELTAKLENADKLHSEMAFNLRLLHRAWAWQISNNIGSEQRSFFQKAANLLQNILNFRWLRSRVAAWKNNMIYEQYQTLQKYIYSVQEVYVIDDKTGDLIALQFGPNGKISNNIEESIVWDEISEIKINGNWQDQAKKIGLTARDEKQKMQLDLFNGGCVILATVSAGEKIPTDIREQLALLAQAIGSRMQKEADDTATMTKIAINDTVTADFLRACFFYDKKKTQSKLSINLVSLLMIIAFAAAVAWLANHFLRTWRWNQLARELSQKDGIMIVRNFSKDGKRVFQGIVDESADPQQHIPEKLRDLVVFKSTNVSTNDLSMILNRFEKTYKKHEDVEWRINDERELVVTGSADSAWIAGMGKAVKKSKEITGVKTIDLKTNDEKTLSNLAKKINSTELSFYPEEKSLINDSEKSLKKLVKDINKFSDLAKNNNSVVTLKIIGHQSKKDSFENNINFARAKKLRERLKTHGIKIDTIEEEYLPYNDEKAPKLNQLNIIITNSSSQKTKTSSKSK